MRELLSYLLLVVCVLFGCNRPSPKPDPPPVDPGPILDVLYLAELHNAERSSPLALNEYLTRAAQDHAIWMAANRRMSHRGEGGSSPAQRILATGYEWQTYGENVAYGQHDPDEVFRVWMRSPGHRRNILSRAYADIGIGIARAENGQRYWCVTFGRTGLGHDEWNEDLATPELEP